MTEAQGDVAPEAVLRLAAARKGEGPFLEPHQVEAARRLALLFERARLAQRVTMSYDPTRVGGKRDGNAQADLSVSAADARRHLADLAGKLPGECWSVLFDICGLDRGLQEVEAERDWPRRSGKLVLRIALTQLAEIYGLGAAARGAETRRRHAWLEERVPMFPDAGRS